MFTQSQTIRSSIHDFDKEYREGAHWDVKDPSTTAKRFVQMLKKGSYILDAGCGEGRDVIYFAKNGFRVTGIDISTVGIELAKERSKGLKGIDFVIGECEDLTFEDNIFDAGHSAYVFEGPAFSKIASELSRVVKPKGLVSIAMFLKTTYEVPGERDSYTPLSFVLKSLRPYFKVKEQTVDRYCENDDAGKHEHERLIILLENKKDIRG